MISFTLMGLFAFQYVNVPYRWGGNDFDGLDCSGFVLKVLRDVEIDLPDMTAQRLYNKLTEKDWRSMLGPDSILFFGKNRQRITHVAIAIDGEYMIEAGSGGSDCLTLEDAIEKDARVKITKISKRSDLQAVLMPEYYGKDNG